MSPRREDFGAWLEGTPAGTTSGRDAGLDLPEEGPGAMASAGRRAVALVLDWAVSMAVASLFWRDPAAVGPGILAADPWATLGVFVVSTIVLVGLLGHSVGHRLLGLRVAPLLVVEPRRGSVAARDGVVTRRPAPGPPGLVAAAVRTALLALVIPAVVWDRSGRGLHDVAARTVVVRR